MEIQQLEYFKTVAEMQHMTHAAEQLNISQPALSKSISNIEQEIGVPLFDRQGRSISLNRYGKLFLTSVDTILKEFEKAKVEIGGLVMPGYGDVAFGFIHTLGMEVVPELMAHVPEKYPNMKFTLTQAASYNLLKWLEEGQVDLCLSQRIESKVIDIEWIELWSEELFVIVPKNHRFANRETIKLEEIKDEPFISIKRGNALRQIVDKLFKEAGITTNMTFAGEEMHTVAGFVGAGLGVSLIPNIKGLNEYNVCKIRVSEPICERKIGVSWAGGRYLSPAAVQFKEYLVEYFKEK
ncbi:LysR family transcriptional regulator [Ureibacillus chungkukjangi]|uniref:DNA-binding transcriptional LysR family regulator n=1 Tax=Ureibacillus chungkukjangi TaxID=1202712 RepID=A0A318TIT1_9BACL|nr:LysR family transcriptional regulator [Ureibacillus chungkukjangi]MCM3389490.1 LysR family transcriptional regulator [Ureibacillus chungkukjangi]PYF04323.1 DNA-binding transcriptional LysR family regulator [Ureibacillus chungkukjangi]HCG4536018.1 LysR family transcriptional regulator [Salmonella enterica subsp. enterica serovar Typhi str. AG3]